ncbi:MAG: carboxypeptidase-like regulatory domain-containing protein [Chitinophagaceae bacterium]
MIWINPQVTKAQITVSGKILDNETQVPLPFASVVDSRTKEGTLTDSLGNFQLRATLNDWIQFSYVGYHPDSFQLKNASIHGARVIVYLRQSNFYLSGIDVKSRRIDYQRDSLERNYLFGDVMAIRQVSGLQAAAHPIDALYDALSKKQRWKWRFQKMFTKYEEQQYIKARIKLSVVEKLTGFHDRELEKFMAFYQPNYYFVRNATDYELYSDIKIAAKAFRKINHQHFPPPFP